MTSSTKVTVASIQHPPVFLNLQESVDRACTLIEEAAEKGANLIVFPETWLPGYPIWLDCAPNVGLWDHPPAKNLFRILCQNAVEIPGPELDRLLAKANEVASYVVMGLHERDGGTLYNTTLFLPKSGADYRIHRKLMPTYTERMIWGWGDGSTLGVLESEYGNIGGLICWEHWMPLARAAMHARRETIHIAQWPMVKDLHQIASRHYAFEGQCFVIAAGCILSKGEMLQGAKSVLAADDSALDLLESIPGDDPQLLLRGGSSVIAPNADFIQAPVQDTATILYAELNLDLIREGNLFLDTDGHYSRPDIFHLEVNEQAATNVTFNKFQRNTE